MTPIMSANPLDRLFQRELEHSNKPDGLFRSPTALPLPEAQAAVAPVGELVPASAGEDGAAPPSD